MKRYLALFFPRWPIQHLRCTQLQTRDQPVALFTRTQHGCRLVYCSGDANTLGIRSGMTVADAHALSATILIQELNVEQCRASLEELCLWATRFTPLTGIEPTGPHAHLPQTLLLDITGCEDVFGGEEALENLVAKSIQKRGYKVRTAIAPTIGAAWALAHFGPTACIVSNDPEELKEKLGALPLASLRLSNEILSDFRPLGLHHIRDLLRQPRESLPSRFSIELMDRLDQAFDIKPEPLVPLRDPPQFRAVRAFEYPIRSSETLFKILEQLMERLTRDLKRAQRGARHLECWIYHELATPACAQVALHLCSNSPKHLWQLLRTGLEDLFRTPEGKSCSFHRKSKLYDSKKDLVIDVDESVVAVAVHVTASEPISDRQLPLFERAKDEETNSELHLLLDRLVTRLGSSAVCRVHLEDDPLPERAFRVLTLSEHSRTKASSVIAANAARPLRLLPQPEPAQIEWPSSLLCAGQRHNILKAEGPERMESGWWRERFQRRDYYMIEVDSGARYWVYFDLLEQRWFLHGLFD